MRDSLLIQRALFAALDGEVLIVGRAEPVPVFDEATETTPAPYIVVGEMTEVPDDTHDGFGTSETHMLHFWSGGKGALATDPRPKGATECKAIMGMVDELLHQRTLVMDDGRRVRVTREFAEVLVEDVEGERWRHGVARYRVRTMDLSPIEDAYYA